jgi:hypothetical protein
MNLKKVQQCHSAKSIVTVTIKFANTAKHWTKFCQTVSYQLCGRSWHIDSYYSLFRSPDCDMSLNGVAGRQGVLTPWNMTPTQVYPGSCVNSSDLDFLQELIDHRSLF